MLEGIIVAIAVLLTAVVLRPPKRYVIVAWTNLVLFLVFSIAFSNFTEQASIRSDALKFYLIGSSRIAEDLATISQANFVYLLSIQIQNLIPLSYTAFNLIGALLFAHTAVLLVLRMTPVHKPVFFKLWLLVTLMPGFHIWHASFGKDSLQLLFFAMFFCTSAPHFRVAGLVLMTLLRPQVALVMVLSMFVANLFTGQLKPRTIVLQLAGSVILVFSVGILFDRLGIQDFSVAGILNSLQGYNEDWRTGSLRLSDTSSPFALVEFLIRPYIWEASSIFHFVSILDNVFLLSMFVLVYRNIDRREFKNSLPILLLLLTFLLAFSNPNVGTATRKKSFFPAVFLLICVNSPRQSARPASVGAATLRRRKRV